MRPFKTSSVYSIRTVEGHRGERAPLTFDPLNDNLEMGRQVHGQGTGGSCIFALNLAKRARYCNHLKT